MFTVGSLFSGIGGFELGLERTGGFKTEWQCEIDPFCLQVLEKHWPDVTRFTDIKQMGIENEIPYVDVICGGFPCQPVSTAGLKRGIEDERWLWPEFFRIIEMVRPRWVLIENVRNLLSIEKGELFKKIATDLSELGCDIEWTVLSASDFGAPHLRERLFIVANFDRVRFTSKKEFDAEQYTEFSNKISNSYRPIICKKPKRSRKTWLEITKSQKRNFEPFLCGTIDGIPNWVDRIKSLGNSIVPQCSEYLGNCILEYNKNSNY